MEAENLPKANLPVIDISPFLRVGEDSNLQEKESVAKALHEACSSVGFFYVKGHGIDPAITSDALALARNFFAQHDDKKQEITITNEQGGGVRFILFLFVFHFCVYYLILILSSCLIEAINA